jgi:hypothetical protein
LHRVFRADAVGFYCYFSRILTNFSCVFLRMFYDGVCSPLNVFFYDSFVHLSFTKCCHCSCTSGLCFILQNEISKAALSVEIFELSAHQILHEAPMTHCPVESGAHNTAVLQKMAHFGFHPIWDEDHLQACPLLFSCLLQVLFHRHVIFVCLLCCGSPPQEAQTAADCKAAFAGSARHVAKGCNQFIPAELWKRERSKSKSARKLKQQAWRSAAARITGQGGRRSSMAFADLPRVEETTAVAVTANHGSGADMAEDRKDASSALSGGQIRLAACSASSCKGGCQLPGGG